jgi:hypothetical protein
MLVLVRPGASAQSAALTAGKNSTEATFAELFRNPEKYDRRRVTITGIADADGGLVWVWRDVKARRDLDAYLERRQRDCDPTDAIFVPYETPIRSLHGLYDHVNGRHVRVTGILDRRIHGHLGGDPFSIVLEDLEVLPGPRVSEFIPIIGFFKNDSGKTIEIETSFGSEGAYAPGIRAGSISCVGKIGQGTIVAKTMKGVVFARGQLIPPRLSDPYYDRPMKSYYFRITSHAIEPVLPKDAIGWNKGYTYDRD